MAVFTKCRDYDLVHTDPESGYGLLSSRSRRDCLFLNPLAVALWRAPVETVSPERDGQVFEAVFDLPESKEYLAGVIGELADRGVLIPADEGAPGPGFRARDPVSLPPLEQVYLYATRDCNARCYHCYQPTHTVEGGPRPPSDNEISSETFLHFLETSLPLGVRGVKITGGEPLLRSDFAAIAGGARRLGLAVSVETNAFFIDEPMAAFLSENEIDVSVSLDGGSPEVHDSLRGLPGSFERVIRALESLISRGRDPTTIMAISRRNLDDVEKVIAAAARAGCRRVKFNPVNSLGVARRLQRGSLLLEVEEIMALYTRRAELEERYGVFLFLEGPPSLATIYETISGHSAVCPFTRIIGILADGSISFCGVGNSCPELVFGNITAPGFEIRTFWATAAPLLEARAVSADQLEGVCSICVLAPYCRGSCRALAYGELGSLRAPHPFCQTAYERGLFPVHYLWGGENVDRESGASEGV